MSYKNTIITPAIYQHRIRAQMERERKDSDLRRVIDQRKNTTAFCESLQKTDTLRKLRKSQMYQQQVQNIKDYESKMQKQQELQKRANYERKVMEELNARKRKMQSTQLYKSRICAESEELKDLLRTLKAAKISHDLQHQISLAKLKSVEDENENVLYLEQMALSLKIAEEKEAKQKAAEKLKLLNNKKIIENQLREKEMAKNIEYEQFLKEKIIINEIMEKLAKEREEKLNMEHLKKLETKKYIDNYLIEREHILVKEKLETEEVNKKIREWNVIQDERLNMIKNIKKEKLKANEEMYDRVKDKIEEEMKEKQKMEDLLIELAMEETQLKIMKEEQLKSEKRQKMKFQIKAENEMQLQMKLKLKMEEKEREEILRKQLLKKYEENAKLQQLSVHQKRLKMIKYKKDVQDIIEERKRLKAVKANEEIKFAMKQNSERENRQSIIKEERLRLLKIHAPLLAKFLITNIHKLKSDEEEIQIIQQYLE